MARSPDQTPLEIWGGVECSLTRIGAGVRDQMALTGHDSRIDDLDRFAALGIKALRYPILWERTERRPGLFDWSWADARLSRIRELGMKPVVGLVHHGAGPAWTHLLDPQFAVGLARFARETARRFPWIDDWTPINEPLTTARFSGLYGHWHPHRRDEYAFWAALLNQIDAIRFAMREIRRTNPRARLLQTEDFGVTSATEPCQAQADHDNQRRLMTWDLLLGHVTPDHPFHDRLSRMGFEERLKAIADDPCEPIVGLNHYLTSDRFLDHRLDRYPEACHGGNGRIAYADVEAVRVLDPPSPGWSAHILKLWETYRRPVVITECHLGCTREEQLRWLNECWTAALSARSQGVRVEAVTAWSLLGAYDWNSLLTRPNGVYESGVFDLAEGSPRPTALCALVQNLAQHGEARIAMAEEAGWWRRAGRLGFRPQPRQVGRPPAQTAPRQVVRCHPTLRTLALERECERRGLGLVSHQAQEAGQAEFLLTHLSRNPAGIARDLDLLIDRWSVPTEAVPCTGHRDTELLPPA